MYILHQLFISLLLTTFSLAAAATELNFNLYQLVAATEEQVDNDIMKVTLTASHQAQSFATVSNKVNQQKNAALKILASSSDINYQTGNYQTHPTYQRQKISGWQASQQLILKSSDVKQMTDLIGKLQSQLKLSSMKFEISKKVRHNVQDKLSVTALNQFKARATLIQQTMGADSYRVVNVDVNSGMQFMPQARSMMMKSAMSMSAENMSAPSVSSGTSKINVRVSGQIQLVFN